MILVSANDYSLIDCKSEEAVLNYTKFQKRSRAGLLFNRNATLVNLRDLFHSLGLGRLFYPDALNGEICPLFNRVKLYCAGWCGCLFNSVLPTLNAFIFAMFCKLDTETKEK